MTSNDVGSQPAGKIMTSNDVGSQPAGNPPTADGVSDYVKDSGNVYRIPLSRIGFYPENRGGRGVDPGHAHDACRDGVQNTMK